MNSRNDSKTIDEDGNEILDPRKALAEQTLAVDLAAVEFDRAVATAHKYPRSIDVVIKKIRTMSCYNTEAAENCIYSLPRGGKPIIGPSIGFANILATSWGNCADGGRPVGTDRKEKVVVAEGVFHDWESNRRTVIYENRRIVDKHGKFYSDDMVIVTGKAAAAIARRNAILNAVPRAIWHPIYEEALKAVRGEVTTFVERKDKALKAFAQFGVTPEKVILALELKGEADLTLDHIPTLRGMYAALRDGTSTVEEMFAPKRMGKGFETVENPLADAPAASAEAAGSQDTEGEESDPTDGMGEGEPAQQTGTTHATVATQQNATTAPQAQAQAAQNQPGATQERLASEELPKASAAPPAAKETAPAPKEAPRVQPDAPKEASPGPQPNDQMRTSDEYMAYWEGFLASNSSELAITGQWSLDRKVRGTCSVVGATFDEAQRLRDERLSAIKAKAAQ